MMRRSIVAACLLLSTVLAAPVDAKRAPEGAKPGREMLVASARVRLGDVVPGAPEELRAVDLGPSPAPGGSRVLSRADIVAALPEGADAKKVSLPHSVRVVRKTTSLAAAALESLAAEAIARRGIEKGGTLVAARPRAAVSVAAGWDRISAELPRLPRKAGKHLTTATLVFLEGDITLAKVPVPVELALPPGAALPDVKKGARLVFSVERGTFEIRVSGAAGADADVGDPLPVTLESGKVVRGRLVSRDPAVATEAP